VPAPACDPNRGLFVERLATLEGHAKGLRGVAWSPDG
jgi:hypothetical protein